MLTDAVSHLTPSATLAITARGKELAAKGEWVINFASGQPDFDTPELIKNAAKKALDDGFTKYTPASGIPELKAAICEKLLRDNGLTYKPSQIIASNGAKQALFETIFALAQKGDEVLIAAPFWVSYPEMVKAAGAKPVIIETAADFKVTPRLLKKYLSKKTKLFIFNAPSNPTGVMYSKSELVSLADVLLTANVWIVSDECYDQFYYGTHPQVSFASLSTHAYAKTITINSLSKSFSMTGWRIGYAAGDERIIRAVSSLQSHLSSNPCSFAQKGGVVALAKGARFTHRMRQEFAKRRKVMVRGLNQIEGIKASLPDGAFFVFADISGVTTRSLEFAKSLLEEEKVTVIPGEPFGAEGYIRLSFSVSQKDIVEGLKRLERFVKTYKGNS